MKKFLLGIVLGLAMIVGVSSMANAFEVQKLYIQGVSPTFNVRTDRASDWGLGVVEDWTINARVKAVAYKNSYLGAIGFDVAGNGMNTVNVFGDADLATGVFITPLNIKYTEAAFYTTQPIDGWAFNKLGNESVVILTAGFNF